MTSSHSQYVPDTRFGVWFLRTPTWQHHVLRVAINDLARLAKGTIAPGATMLDVGCGQGKSLSLLQQTFQPGRLIGLDSDQASLDEANAECNKRGLQVELIRADCSDIPLPDASVDVVFCHQTFHHLVDQQTALDHFQRVLKPGGVLLFAESTKAYIDTWVIRLLFRHPMEVQKSADEYLAMLRRQGFSIATDDISYPYLWWSRATDFGLLERLGLKKPPPFGEREETLLNLVARKPAH